MSFLRLDDLHMDLGEFSLRGVSLRVERGDYLTVMGPTGAGKTILLECIIGFYRPGKGRVFMDGVDITDMPPEKRRIGIVYQDYALLPHLTVSGNIEYGLRKVDPDKASRARKVRDMAASLQIDHLMHRRPDTLSGGEQQRVALSRALVVEPRMLLMDEPLSALDPRTRHDIRNLLRKVVKKRDITVLHITHDMDDVYALADKVAILKGGILVQHDTTHRVFHRPCNGFIADFVGAAVFDGRTLQGNGGGSRVSVNGLTLNSLDMVTPETEVRVAIRPENVMVCSRPPDGGSARNVVKGILQDLYQEGRITHLSFNANGVCIPVLVTTSTYMEMGLEPGEERYLVIKAANVRIV